MSFPPPSTPAESAVSGHFGWQVALDGARRQAPGKLLLLDHRPVDEQRFSESGHAMVRLGSGGPIQARAAALPFADRSIDLVVVREGLAGPGDVLDELLRVIGPAGRLVVLAEGAWRLPPRRPKRRHALTSIRLLRQLMEQSFVIEHCEGRGLAGTAFRSGPGWRRHLLSAADEWALCARRHEGGSIIRPLKFAAPRAVGARGAALDGVNREAVA